MAVGVGWEMARRGTRDPEAPHRRHGAVPSVNTHPADPVFSRMSCLWRAWRLWLQLSADEQDSVRLLAVTNCLSIGRLLSVGDYQSSVYPVMRSVSHDKSCAYVTRVGRFFAGQVTPEPARGTVPNEYCTRFHR